MMLDHFVCLLTVVTTLGSLVPTASPECLSNYTTCEYTFNVHFKQTMVDRNNQLVYLHEGKLYHFSVKNTSSATPVPLDEVITADGYETPRLVVAINNQMPGPTISVYQGQKIIVNVINNLHSDAITIHWHGIHQRGTPWMDGAAYVTQCPILPGHSFRYEFLASQTGTFFYHSHLGMLGSMGLHGPLIIKPRNEPAPMEEFVVMMTEWTNTWEGDMQLEKNMYLDYTGGVVWTIPGIDGSSLSRVKFDAGLINGRGRHFDTSGIPNTAPLTKYTVAKSSRYLFRVIGGGYGFPFRVSVDGHGLTIVASDGVDIEPITVESFIINNGERFDFILTADQNVDNYWLRAQTLEKGVDHKAEAIIHYVGAPEALPTTSKQICNETNPCIIVNCPFAIYPGLDYSMCIPFDQLNSTTDQTAFGVELKSMKQIFLNFAFPGGVGYRHASVNGHVFKLPKSPPLTQPKEMKTQCDQSLCGSQKLCFCSYTFDINNNEPIQLILSSYGNGMSGPHPVHLHGHVFQVLKMGFHQQDTNGQYMDVHPDIACDDTYCNEPSWSNSSWTATTIPGLKLHKPPLKDSLTISRGSYAVVRFQADNPGVWMLHCHMDPHMSRGMAMLINVTMAMVPSPPSGFPQCREFPAPDWVVDGMTDNAGHGMEPENMDEDTMKTTTFWIVVGILLGLVVSQTLVIICMCIRSQRNKASFPVSEN